ncbi:hypothetical protein H4582DRAFT_1982631 [Lactarius indigo]|nr:hypothetical protein H4582DRAFT_1995632 [Lactarius indigo]KAI9434109.1 hypothetical protein H4582DRAFT_1982631 [Lactarius indigo]
MGSTAMTSAAFSSIASAVPYVFALTFSSNFEPAAHAVTLYMSILASRSPPRTRGFIGLRARTERMPVFGFTYSTSVRLQ